MGHACIGPGCFRCKWAPRRGGAASFPRAAQPAAPCVGCRGEEEWGPDGPPAWARDADAIAVNHGAGGIGDALQGLVAVAALKRENPGRAVTYRVSPAALPWVWLFDGYDALAPHEWDEAGAKKLTGPARQINNGYGDEIRARGRVRRWERYARAIGVKGGPALPALRDRDRLLALGRDDAGCVALAPFSHYADREYALPGWLTLEAKLRAAGYRTVVLHGDADRARPFRGEKLTGQPAERVAGAILNAACLVGNDSGLAHLAGLLGTPTVVLCGQTKGESVFGCYPRMTYLEGEFACSGCYWQAPHTSQSCQPRCPSLQSITPARVLAAVDAACLPAAAGGRTLLDPARLATIRDALLATGRLPGDVAELGVYRGGVAKLIGRYAPSATLRLFDTFAGLPEDDEAPGGHRAGEFADGGPAAEVLAFLGNPNAVAHAGVFPGTAPADARYRFVHVDADLYQSTKAALEYFVPRMAPGGVMVFDDLDWPHCPGVRRALAESGLRVERTAEYQGAVRF